MIIYESVAYNSVAYQQAVALRRQLLRTPLGLDFSAQQLADEASEHHFVARADEGVIACLSAQLHGEGVVKFRQMAVADDWQGKGIGAALLEHAHSWATDTGCVQAQLHARISAQIFYEKMGYAACGEPFIEVTIPHIKMIRKL